MFLPAGEAPFVLVPHSFPVCQLAHDEKVAGDQGDPVLD
jgi:hypothetical protein